MKKAFLIFLFLFLIPAVGLSTSFLLKNRHDNSFYSSVEKQMNKSRAQLKSMNIIPQEVCINAKNDIKLKYFCAHYGRFDRLRSFSVWAFVIGGGVLVFVLIIGMLLKASVIAFFIAVLISLLGLAASFVLQTITMNYIVALMLINLFNKGFPYGIAEGLGILGILLSFGNLGVAVQFVFAKKDAAQNGLFQRARNIVQDLSVAAEDCEGDHFIHQVAFAPGKVMLQYCLTIFKENCSTKCKKKG